VVTIRFGMYFIVYSVAVALSIAFHVIYYFSANVLVST
jgi:hypothetical protein